MIIKNANDIQLALMSLKIEILNTLAENKDGAIIEVSPLKSKRSKLQNDFYWGVIGDLVELFNYYNMTYIVRGFNIAYNKEVIHEINKLQFDIKSTAKLSKKEFVDFMDKLFAFWITETKGKWKPKELTRGYLERHGYE